MKDRFRGVKSFLFLMLLPLLVMGGECSTYGDIGSNQYKEEILDASSKGWISCKDKFYPSINTTRIEALKMSLLAGGHNPSDTTEQCFDDVATDSWQNKYACYGKNKGFLVNRSDFKPNDYINFAEASKLILLSMTNENYGESDPWYQKYLDKMSLYKINDGASDLLHRDYYIHILTEIKEDPNREPIVEEPKLKSVTLSKDNIVEGDSVTVNISLTKSLPSGYDVYGYIPNYSTQTFSCGTKCSKTFRFDDVGDNQKITITLKKNGSTIDSKNVYLNVKEASVVIPDPTVSSVTPNEANLYEKTTFTVNGTNLTSTLNMTIPYCENMKQESLSSTQVKFSCTPSKNGLQDGLIRTKINGTVLKLFDVNMVLDTSNYIDIIDYTDVYPKSVIKDNNLTLIVHLKEPLPNGYKVRYQFDYNQDGVFDDKDNVKQGIKYLTQQKNTLFYTMTKEMKAVGYNRRVKFAIVDNNGNLISEWVEDSYSVEEAKEILESECTQDEINKFASYKYNGYFLPAKYETKIKVTQGNNGTLSHHGYNNSAYAIDFIGVSNPNFTVVATKDGIVESIMNSTYGKKFCENNPDLKGVWKTNNNILILKHSDGSTSKYMHLDKFLVKKGQEVKRGESIGIAGNTGCSTATHLHFEIRDSSNKSQFIELEDSNGEPRYLTIYTSKNCKTILREEADIEKQKYQFENFLISDKIVYEGVSKNFGAEFDIRNITENKIYYQNLDISIHYKNGEYFKNCWAEDKFGVLEVDNIFSTNLQECTLDKLGDYRVVAKVLPLNTDNWIDSTKQWEIEVKENNRIDLGINIISHTVTTPNNDFVSGSEFTFEVITDKLLPMDYKMYLILEGAGNYSYLKPTLMNMDNKIEGKYRYWFTRTIDKVGDNRKYKIKALKDDGTLENVLVDNTYSVKSFVDKVYPVETKYIGEEFNFSIKFKKEIHSDYNVSIQFYDGDKVVLNKQMLTDDYITYKLDKVIRKFGDNRKYTITIKKIQTDKHQAPVEVIEGVYKAKDIEVEEVGDFSVKYDAKTINNFAFKITPPNANYDISILDLNTWESFGTERKDGLYVYNVENTCDVSSNLVLQVKVGDNILKEQTFNIANTDAFQFGDLSGKFTEFVKPISKFQVYLGDNVNELNSFKLCGGDGCQDLVFNSINNKFEVDSSWFLNTLGLHYWYIERQSKTECKNRVLKSDRYSSSYILDRDAYQVYNKDDKFQALNLANNTYLNVSLYNIGDVNWTIATPHTLYCNTTEDKYTDNLSAIVGDISKTYLNIDIPRGIGPLQGISTTINNNFKLNCQVKNKSLKVIKSDKDKESFNLDIEVVKYTKMLEDIGLPKGEIDKYISSLEDKNIKNDLLKLLGNNSQDITDLYNLDETSNDMKGRIGTLKARDFDIIVEYSEDSNYPAKVYGNFKLKLNTDDFKGYESIIEQITEDLERSYQTAVYEVDNYRQKELLKIFMRLIIMDSKEEYRLVLEESYNRLRINANNQIQNSMKEGIHDALIGEFDNIVENVSLEGAVVDLAYTLLLEDIVNLYQSSNPRFLQELHAQVQSIDGNITILKELLPSNDVFRSILTNPDFEISTNYFEDLFYNQNFTEDMYDSILKIKFEEFKDANTSYMLSFSGTKAFLSVSATAILRNKLKQKVTDLGTNGIFKLAKIVFKPLKVASMALKMKKIMRKMSRKSKKGTNEIIQDIELMAYRLQTLKSLLDIEGVKDVKSLRATSYVTGLKDIIESIITNDINSIPIQKITTYSSLTNTMNYYDRFSDKYSVRDIVQQGNSGTLKKNAIGESGTNIIGPKPNEIKFQAHHLIPTKVHKDLLENTNFYINDMHNTIFLPETFAEDCKSKKTRNNVKFKCTKLVHRGKHPAISLAITNLIEDDNINKLIAIRELSRLLLVQSGPIFRLNDGDNAKKQTESFEIEQKKSKTKNKFPSNLAKSMIGILLKKGGSKK